MVGVAGLKVISRINVAIAFLETIYPKNKKTAKIIIIIIIIIIEFFTVCRAKIEEMTKFGSKN